MPKIPKYILGLDIGGTKIQAGILNDSYKLISTKRFSSNAQKDKNKILQSIIHAISSLHSNKVVSIGIAIAGIVDHRHGILIRSPNFNKNWRDIPLRKIIRKKFRVPTVVENDAHCITLAEAIKGAGKSYRTVFSLTLGTGIGSGFVIDKKIYHGANNAIEFGHTIISEQPIKCSCGRTGHFESFVSGPGLTKIYKTLTQKIKDPLTIENEALDGNIAALKTLQTASHYLGVGLINIIRAYNPDIIILGGGLSKVKQIINPAIKQVKGGFNFAELKKTRIVVSNLGYNAGVLGAALITNKKINKCPSPH